MASVRPPLLPARAARRAPSPSRSAPASPAAVSSAEAPPVGFVLDRLDGQVRTLETRAEGAGRARPVSNARFRPQAWAAVP